MNANSGNGIERRKKDSARLIWDTKPKRAPNPKDIEFQTAEVVIPNPHRDQARLPSFMESLSKTTIDKTKMNRLIWGDNLLAMQALLASGYEGKIDLIYIDPPFWTGENYYTDLIVGGQQATKSPSVIERLAFKDIWEGGIDSFLDMLFPRLQLMRRLLADNGSIYLHVDWHIGHYIKVLMDEVFKGNFRNEIVWKRSAIATNVNTQWRNSHDVILFYTKTRDNVFNVQFGEYSESSKKHFCYSDKEGTFSTVPLMASGRTSGPSGQTWRGINPGKRGKNGMHWLKTPDVLEQLDKEGKIFWTTQRVPRLRYYLSEAKGVYVPDFWDDISVINSMAKESVGYATQKPEALMERIIKASSNEGSLIADFFCGSGTTLVVAEGLKRRWIGCDFSKVAIQTTRNRLVRMDSKPFLLENIGNYQRHLIYLSGVRIYEMQAVVLKLYGATPREDLPDLGTRKSSDGIVELIYVSYPDRPVTAKKVEEIAYQAEKLDGTGYKRLVILGWDYEYNYEEGLKDRKRAAQNKWKTEVVNKTIPPEVYEYLKTAKAEEEIEPLRNKIYFHEKPYLKLAPPEFEKMENGKAKVTVGIERYVVFDYPIEDEKKRQEIMEIAQKDYFALVDYWAIDWDHDNITFKSVWQAFRGFGRDIKEIPKTATKEIETGKRVTIAVRLVDVFGNDASASQVIDLRSA
jgi:DNA modification methylase